MKTMTQNRQFRRIPPNHRSLHRENSSSQLTSEDPDSFQFTPQIIHKRKLMPSQVDFAVKSPEILSANQKVRQLVRKHVYDVVLTVDVEESADRVFNFSRQYARRCQGYKGLRRWM